MVKKLNFVFAGNYTCDRDCNSSTSKLLTFNQTLNNVLKHSKDLISPYYKNKKWDKYKKFANEYELVFTSCYGFPSISKHVPISRSYFKLWEILHDYRKDLNINDASPKKCMFLAEGPGGFIEAYCNYRYNLKGISPDNDSLYGITLISKDKNVPQWKVPTSTMPHNLQLLFGIDSSGDLYNISNINDIIKSVGNYSVDFITADGGFDFSKDFNSQEDISLPLILSEIYVALQIQKPGGNFVLKIYDIFNETTIKLLYVLKMCYEEIHIIKPLSSRPANSEKYILCKNFTPKCSNYSEVSACLLHAIVTKNIECLEKIQTPTAFVKDIIYYNISYIAKQVCNITKTLIFVDYFNKNQDAFRANLKLQLTKALRWCYKYNIAISPIALQAYNQKYNYYL